MTGRSNADAAVNAGRRMLEQAVDAGIRRAQDLTAKPSLKRYSWSRFHSDLLDDVRWSLVAKRAQAPLPVVEALILRIEVHANRSQPRGYVGDFNAEAMAARWGVEADIVLRILDELERSDIGWIDQDQVVSFWARNPDKVDETAAERMQRMRDRKKGMKQLATLARQGLITEAERADREAALKNSREPKAVIAGWASPSQSALRRNAVTVTPRAEQIIKQEGGENAQPIAALNAVTVSPARIAFADKAKALQWLRGEGEALVTRRLSVMRSKAGRLIERWSVTLGHDVTALAEILAATGETAAQGPAFEKLVLTQVARRAANNIGPALPLPPVAVK